ncbi:MAG: acyl-CoA dehydrogenase family protein [Deltaproteobacteria bacterium]|nr:acyl-CoA dehydrogenase family protein [Deltaproteobacteria bacterium]
MNDRHAHLQERIARFAAREVATRKDLSVSDLFPADLWQKMGEEGLLGLSIPEAYGGAGDNYRSMIVALKSFVQSGHNMGMALSWMIHLIVARFFILSFGQEGQIDACLRPMARGELTGSIAISEPGTGAHPKHVKTTAQRKGDRYEINGEKAYLTNGTFADFFMVFSVTGLLGDHKEFTFIIVPRDAEGVHPGSLMKIDFLKPSPHCGVRFDHCIVPLSNQLGENGTAYEKMSKPFRPLEDVLLMGPVMGGMILQLEMLLGLIQKTGIRDMEGLKEKLGEIQVSLDAVDVIAEEAARICDNDLPFETLDALTVFMKIQSKNIQAFIASIASGIGIAEDPAFNRITHDLRKTVQLAEHVSKIKMRNMGDLLLSKG